MEEETKSVAVLFGRMNPPTSGHEENVNGLKKLAAKHNADHLVIASHSHDPKKNPLSPEDKVKHLKRAFPGTNVKSATKERPTIMHHAADLHGQGYTHLVVAGGGDRAEEYKRLLNQYNGKEGKHGFYNFKKITVTSTGERKSGVSGTDMRAHVKNNNFDSFRENLPSTLQNNQKHAQELFHDVKKGMGVHENFQRGMFKAMFLVGGPGSGKDVIIREAVSEKNAVEINANKAFDFLMDKKRLSEDTKDYQLNAIKNHTALIINGASDDKDKISSLKEELEELGYTTMMVFVNTTNQVSQNRNNQHSRVISEQVRSDKWMKSQDNLNYFYELFDYFLEFDNSINLQEANLLNKEAKQNEISDICNEISYFYKTKVKGELNENYSKLLKKNNHKNYSGILSKQGLSPKKFLNDGNAYKDNALRKAGTIDDVRDGDIQRNSGFSNGANEEKEKVLPQEQEQPTLKINPEPKQPNFTKDKETPNTKRKAGVSLLPGKVMNGAGVGPTYDTRQQGTVYPMGGLGNVTYRESFQEFRRKLKKESIDEPGTVEMGTFGGMGNGVNKEGPITQLDRVVTRSEDKVKSKKKPK
jgi:predicted kinase